MAIFTLSAELMGRRSGRSVVAAAAYRSGSRLVDERSGQVFDYTRKAVEHALRSGYRHIDAAHIYENEHEVGAGWKASGVPRDQIFVRIPSTLSHFHLC